jgi:acyl carrier protein
VSVAADVEEFILEDIAAGRGIDSVAPDDDLLAEDVIDSLGIMQLISFLEGKYGIKVTDEDLNPENFRSVQRIVTFVEQKGVART